MKIRTIIVIAIFFLVLLIAGFNWEAFSEPIPIFLLFTTVNLPIGVSMLAVLAILGAVMLALVGKTQTVALFEHRSLTKQLSEAQKLANKEEESRFRDLKNVLGEEIEYMHRKLDMIIEHMDIDIPQDAEPVPHGEAEIPAELPPKQLED